MSFTKFGKIRCVKVIEGETSIYKSWRILFKERILIQGFKRWISFYVVLLSGPTRTISDGISLCISLGIRKIAYSFFI